jgi:hypothetical protein
MNNTNIIAVGDRIIVRFPALNKNNTLAENTREIARDARRVTCSVEKVIAVNAEYFAIIANSLLADRSTMWEEVGGYCSEKDATLVCILRNEETGEVMAVNTEGYEYARYVGEVIATPTQGSMGGYVADYLRARAVDAKPTKMGPGSVWCATMAEAEAEHQRLAQEFRRLVEERAQAREALAIAECRFRIANSKLDMVADL